VIYPLLILALFYNVAQAFNANSLTWQKLALEERVERKFHSTLSPVLKENQYINQTEVELNDPGAPNFGSDNQHSGPRVSDLNMTESRGDYIAFSKVGLEVPVVEKFLDEDRTKLMNMYRFNEAYDLFKNLTAVNVTVFLSDKLPEDLVEMVKKIVTSSKLSVSGIKPSVKFESIALEWIDPEIAKKAELDAKKKAEEEKKNQKKKEEEPKIWKKDWYEWASRWGNAFGIILATLILGTISIVLFRMWKDFMEKYAELHGKDKAAEAVKKDDDHNKDHSGEVAVTSKEAQESKEEEDMYMQNGFVRFQQCLAQHPDDAINMIRFWITEGDEHSILALRTISQLSSPEELEKMMMGLSDSQRSIWKGHLGKHLESQEILMANKHIFQEVVKAFLVPSRIKDSDLLNKIMDLGQKSLCEFFNKHPEHTGILLNLLSPTMISRILTEVDNEKAEAWLLMGAEFEMNELENKLAELKHSLSEFKSSFDPSPFAQRIISIIPTVSPSRENALYRALNKAGAPHIVVELACKNFPSELIFDLPGTLLKEILLS
jgi:hypothetical protein